MKKNIVVLFLFFQAVVAYAAYPDRPIRLIVAYPPGGGTDIVSRLIVPELSKRLGQSITIDNRGGASGNIGTDSAVNSPPNGYTLLMGNIGPNAINVSIFKKLPYQPERDLIPISLVAITPNILVANMSLPVKSIADLLVLAKASPGKINFPSAGSGTSSHLAGVLFCSMANVDMVHVPYKGGGVAMNDLLGGTVDIYFATMPAAIPFIKSGKLRPLGVTSDKRSLILPNIPTIAESGLPGYSATTWYGLYAPKGTPNEIIRQIHDATVEVLKIPELREQLIQRGFEPIGNSPEQFSAFVSSEIIKWAKVVKLAGIEPE
ncbi:MAG: tripartite tricarboxylate transporter substrate binding protein [Betaproteobacteria bacterium]